MIRMTVSPAARARSSAIGPASERSALSSLTRIKRIGHAAAARTAYRHIALALCLALQALAATVRAEPATADWPAFGGAPENDHYSPLRQFTKRNVHRLREAWRYDMPVAGDAQTNPLVIDGILYGYTPDLQVVALDAATGRELWRFDAGLEGPELGGGRRFTGPSRGLAYWSDGRRSRLFASVMNYLFALDPATGRTIDAFAAHGAIDLREGLGDDPARYYVALTSPGVVFEDLLIVGFRTTESSPAPPGDIRAFDVRTGRLRWTFHTIPRSGEPGAETWPAAAARTSGGANNWAGMALDRKRGIVYVPTGSATADFYGADRRGSNLYANTLLALDARSGRRLWHFQTTHHDLWDRDLPAAPTLLTIERDGRRVDAVAQATKQGYVFVFDRETGVPLFPIEERPVAASDVPGEAAWPTQPVPLAPAPCARQSLDEHGLARRTPALYDWAVAQFRQFRVGPQYTPFTVGRQTVIVPGFDGGAEWGGAAADPERGVLYLNCNDVAWTGSLVRTVPGAGLAAALYAQHCSTCHGAERKGSPPEFPSLVDVGARLSPDDLASVIRNGRGRMPAFPMIDAFTMPAFVEYVRTGRDVAQAAAGVRREPEAVGTRREMNVVLGGGPEPAAFRFGGFHKFLDPEGYPAVAPPWGTLSAFDLNTGRTSWRVPLGEYPELVARGVRGTGSENYGGPVLTATGLLFIGATTHDAKLRAFDSANGRLLWAATLPYAGTATPAVYAVQGRQYLVILTSNQRNPQAPQGSAWVAYSLP